MLLTSTNKLLIAKFLNQGYWYHEPHKAFSKFYRCHFNLVSKFNDGLKSLLQQGLSEPEFYAAMGGGGGGGGGKKSILAQGCTV